MRPFHAIVRCLAIAALLPVMLHAQPATTRVSVDSAGFQANMDTVGPVTSLDGRWIAFGSAASNLVPGDTNGTWDIFVHDTQTGATSRVNLGPAGTQTVGPDGSWFPALSADGRLVSFQYWAANLVPGDTNDVPDVFVHDQHTGSTTRVSVGGGGLQSNGNSYRSVMSADGRWVAFDSYATNLVSDDTNGAGDIFLHDRQTGATTRVSVGAGGTQGSSHSLYPSISADGRWIAFDSSAGNLVPGDTNGNWDAFVHDRLTGTTTRVSVGAGGVEGNHGSGAAAISADGRWVAFSSPASNLVPNDTNSRIDVFVHDRQTGATTRASVGPGGVQGNGNSWNPAISADGRAVAFASEVPIRSIGRLTESRSSAWTSWHPSRRDCRRAR